MSKFWLEFFILLTFSLHFFGAKKVGGKPERLGLDCCPTLRVSSSALGTRFQSEKMGLYKAMKGKLNNRKVYKHTEGDRFLYYWSWGKKQGENWMLGNSYRSSVHGIESPDMENSHHGWCPSDINKLRIPFRVHTSGGTWLRDTMMRVECVDVDKPCCRRVRLVSRGLAATYQPGRLGTYTATALRNYRYFYTKDEGAGFIYYWDWGPNSGSNWLISSNSDGTNRGIESDNVESGATNYTMCLNQAKRSGDFRVYNGEKQEWDFDSTFRVLCLDEPQVGGPSLNETSQPLDDQN